MIYVKCLLVNLFIASSSTSGETVSLRRRLGDENIPSPPFETSVSGLGDRETLSKPATINNGGRPKMHTFFTPVSASPDTALLDAWQKEWYEAGWEPVILTVKDAKKHEDYNKFIEAFGAAEHSLSDYDRMCFLRWLAMASSGGGWMSDYDTFPLYSKVHTDGHNLPNGGNFTGYSRHVPNLVSGSEAEWNRMANLIFLSYKLHTDGFWSDMRSLLEIHDTIDGYVYQTDSISLEKVYLDDLEKGRIERPLALGQKCGLLTGMRAIHFSHADCEVTGFCEKDRTKAQLWIESWREKCNIR